MRFTLGTLFTLVCCCLLILYSNSLFAFSDTHSSWMAHTSSTTSFEYNGWLYVMGAVILMVLVIITGVKMYIKNVKEHNGALKKYNDKLNKEIKERERFEKALKQREQFLLLLMNNIPQQIYWVDKSHNIKGANAAFLESVQIDSSESVINKNISNFYSDKDHLEHQIMLKSKVMNTGKAIFKSVQELRSEKQKKSIWLEKCYIPLRDDNEGVIGVLIAAQDISDKIKAQELLKSHSENLEYLIAKRTTELAQKNKEVQQLIQQLTDRNEELEALIEKRTEKLRESNTELIRSNKDLEQFAYIASHDLKEPLRIIGNFVGLLGRRYKDKLDEAAMEYIDFAQDGVSRMTGLIESILAYSRIGRKDQAFQNINLNSTIELKMLDLSQRIKENNVQINVAPMPTICCEKSQLGMVFYNLINNAIKFNKSEAPTINIQSHEDAEDGFWKFSVADNGIGIAPEFQKRVFEIFCRLHTKQEYEGTGIGLSLCQKIIERHGGKIWVESKLEEGTTFFFTINKNLETKNIEENKVPQAATSLN